MWHDKTVQSINQSVNFTARPQLLLISKQGYSQRFVMRRNVWLADGGSLYNAKQRAIECDPSSRSDHQPSKQGVLATF